MQTEITYHSSEHRETGFKSLADAVAWFDPFQASDHLPCAEVGDTLKFLTTRRTWQ